MMLEVGGGVAVSGPIKYEPLAPPPPLHHPAPPDDYFVVAPKAHRLDSFRYLSKQFKVNAQYHEYLEIF